MELDVLGRLLLPTTTWGSGEEKAKSRMGFFEKGMMQEITV
jgi:hypothetical protein